MELCIALSVLEILVIRTSENTSPPPSLYSNQAWKPKPQLILFYSARLREGQEAHNKSNQIFRGSALSLNCSLIAKSSLTL